MSNAPRTTDGTANAPREERVFVDAEGIRWRVYEQAFSDYDRRRGASLIFASDGAVRRVRDYPAGWADAADAELIELSWKS